MLNNIDDIYNLRSLSRSKSNEFETKSIHPKLIDEYLAQGWDIEKKHKRSIRLRRPKKHGILLEDKVWHLLYKMNFTHLSKDGGAKIQKDPNSPANQIDVVSIDDDVAIAIECKSSEKYARRPQFQEELGKFSLIRESFALDVNNQFEGERKKQVALAMFLSNISLSDNDKERAKQANIIIFDDHDLDYYKKLAKHLGPAAKYQFLADIFPGKLVPGLTIKVPAVRTKMGGAHCFTFSISPEYLLKIAYVSHRSKGKASDINTYQRILIKKRLVDIGNYIDEDGIFPTNIVINFEKKTLNFQKIHQEEARDPDAGVLGWLDIKAAYKSAWIIDGQHRLFAYSGHDRASKSLLSVLAFEGLMPSKQAELFIDINAKQKSVKQSLLQELYAELHWDSDKDEERLRAIVSKAIQELDALPDSPFCKRIQKADTTKDAYRCISLSSIYGAIEKTEFYIAKAKHGHILEYGPLWAGDNNLTLTRTVYILKNWFDEIQTKVKDWWEKGSGDGGGLSMNDGIITCINVLRSVFQHLDQTGKKLIHLDNEDLFACIKPYGEVLGHYFASFSDENRKQFRDLRGVQGQTTRTRRCQKAVHDKFPSFNPAGLERFLEEEKAQTNIKGKTIIDRMETTLQKVMLEELKKEFGSDDSQWWILGVPKKVRLKVTKLFEEEDGKRGGKEFYFDLIDYRDIAVNNWDVFEKLLAYGKTGNKDKRTLWLNFVNDKRKIVAHASSAMTLTIEDLAQLEEYDLWLSQQINGGES